MRQRLKLEKVKTSRVDMRDLLEQSGQHISALQKTWTYMVAMKRIERQSRGLEECLLSRTDSR
jgi:hypothetical protein